MTNKEAIDFMELAVSLARIAPDAGGYAIAIGVAKLARLGNEARTHAERQCNENLTDDYCERKRASIARRAEGALKAAGIPCGGAVIEVHGDPRGSCLQIFLKRPSGLDLEMRF